MKKFFKGFTLVECIVAMAILGVASLLIAQIYGAVATRNRMNNLVNTSLINQMAYVEKYTNSDVVPLYFGGSGNQTVADAHSVKGTAGDGLPPHKNDTGAVSTNSGYSSYVKFTSDTPIKFYSGAGGSTTTYSNIEYSYAADVYILKSRDSTDSVLTTDAGYSESSYNLRYKYILGHSN